MGWSSHHKDGLIYHSPQHSYRGYTLLTTNGSNYVKLIDMEGRVCHQWYYPERLGYGYLLDNGNLLFRTISSRAGGQRSDAGPRSGAIVELDWEGREVWRYENPLLHHDFDRLPNGNTLVLLFEPLEPELASSIKGGSPKADRDVEMLGDLVEEISPEGETVYSWRSWEHLDPEDDEICFLENREEWTHQNSLRTTPNGDLIVSFRRTDTVGIVDKQTGDWKWKWGPGEISHQHYPNMLDNGNILLFDNGCHRPGFTFSRAVEVNPETSEIAWEYKGDPPISFYSFHISGAERLPNGNTLICEGAPGRVFEVTPNREIVWEYMNPEYVYTVRDASRANSLFRAHRYGPDHPALVDKDLDPDKFAALNRLYGG
ncbi:MAG: aryl-sulfate sulfotransferase [Chloroflexi bacterium]|nr:aryl-sulfate sulfotransferase [Chloroflexota bacterium]